MQNHSDTYTNMIHAVMDQLQSELFLGAKWLPVPVTSSSNEDQKQMKQKKLDQLAKTIRDCTGCPLHQQRLNTVLGQGNPDARLVFVGEAPGQSEDQQGLPFVGRAGKLLDNIINAMGLSRQEVYICNILKCRPPDNRDPQASEIMACISYLYDQLDIIQPEIIVALGAHAARTLLDTTTPIGQLRGQVHQYVPHPMAQPIKLIPTYHPAYLLRNYSPDNRRRVWEDMKKVLTELDLPIPDPQNQKS